MLYVELLVFHRRFDGRRDLYRPSLREWVEEARRATHPPSAMSTPSGSAARRRPASPEWLARRAHLRALIEPTVPCVAPLRGDGYEHAGSDYELISLTHYWNWTGFPVVALPAGSARAAACP